jgi:hypothetical protein
VRRWCKLDQEKILSYLFKENKTQDRKSIILLFLMMFVIDFILALLIFSEVPNISMVGVYFSLGFLSLILWAIFIELNAIKWSLIESKGVSK